MMAVRKQLVHADCVLRLALQFGSDSIIRAPRRNKEVDDADNADAAPKKWNHNNLNNPDNPKRTS